MTLLALGINHKTAPVALREKVTFSPDSMEAALTNLLEQPSVSGGVVLSTCNRTEIYLSVDEQNNQRDQLIDWLCRYHNINPQELMSSLYWHQDNEAVSHLMRVASGLDSLVLGEPQILGQVKKPLLSHRHTVHFPVNWNACSRNLSLSPNGCALKPISVPMRYRWRLPPVPWRDRFSNPYPD